MFKQFVDIEVDAAHIRAQKIPLLFNNAILCPRQQTRRIARGESELEGVPNTARIQDQPSPISAVHLDVRMSANEYGGCLPFQVGIQSFGCGGGEDQVCG